MFDLHRKFDLHFEENGVYAASQVGAEFLKENRRINRNKEGLKRLYTFATEDGLRVSFEDKDVFEELTAIPAIPVVPVAPVQEEAHNYCA